MVFERPPSNGGPSRYQVLGRLAGGGMAEILLGKMTTGTGIAKHVVLKRVLAEYGDDPEYLQMFLDEARVSFTLAHPNIAQVYDFTEIDGAYYLAMEYVHGENTHHLLVRSAKNRQPVPLDIAATIIVGAAGGLHHAHTRTTSDRRPLGIVHRDVSPSNIMLSFEGSVKVVDFGVAKATNQQGQRLAHTHAGATKGKVGYMSPEQIRAPATVDRRSDIFTLGIVMWELLTCKRLYKRATDLETMEATCNHIAPPPSRFRDQVPPGFDAVVARALAKDPESRFATAGEMLVAVEKAAVSAGLVLSTFNLGSFITELFGETPEPWVELSTVDRRHDAEPTTDVHSPALTQPGAVMATLASVAPTAAPAPAPAWGGINDATEVEGIAFPGADAVGALVPFDVGEPSDPNDERWLPLAQEASVATADLIAAKLTGGNPVLPPLQARMSIQLAADNVAVAQPAIGDDEHEDDDPEADLTATQAEPYMASARSSASSSVPAPTARLTLPSLLGQRRSTWFAIALLLVAAAGAGVWFALQDGKPERAAVVIANVAALISIDAAPTQTAEAAGTLDTALLVAATSDAGMVSSHAGTPASDAALAVVEVPPFTSVQLLRACAKDSAGNELACALAACEQNDRIALRRFAKSASVHREVRKTVKCARLLKVSATRPPKKVGSGAAVKTGVDCDKEPLKCQF